MVKKIKSLSARLVKKLGTLPSRMGTAAKNIRQVRKRIGKKHLFFAGGTVLLAIILYTANLYWPRTTPFSYSQPNCFVNSVFLPNLMSPKQSPSFHAELTKSFKLANYPLYSHKTCISPTQVPKEGAREVITLSLHGNRFLQKSIRVAPGPLPALSRQVAPDAPVPTNRPLTFSLDQPDQVFDYRLNAQNKQVDCSKEDRVVSCDVSQLKLAQSKRYAFTVQRLFHGTPSETVFEKQLATVDDVRITKSNVPNGKVVYDVPKTLTFTLNRAAQSVGNASLELVTAGKRQKLNISTSLKDKVITVRLDKPLPRQATLGLTIDNVTAADGGYMAKPFSTRFKTSGGPKVMGVSIGGAKLQPGGSITLSFDSKLSAKQNLGKFVQLQSRGTTVAATVSLQGDIIVLTPQGALPRCSSFTVKVIDGLQNKFGVSGGSAWQFSGQVICQTVFSIGTSVQGRPITAYSFGSGSRKIFFVGATHGDEQSSAYLLQSWVSHLEANAHRIPAGRTITVIPVLNPDGFAAGTRTNAHNVDLNRNFPANDWKSGVTMPNQTYLKYGGGKSPLSEPESKALANYVLGQRPWLVLTYHAVAGVVIPNGTGNSVAQAQTYDQRSNVGYASNGETDSIFHYDTTGAFEDWLHDKVGIPALLIELWTKSGYELDSHLNAMWAML
ncbi:MAG TPA: DUF2817 domain-containing protein [Candidatus Limnocylindria bacterium]|nr:DUF2817 domain-containing protein [Candidatus Limnocylindria bacterium]